MKLQIIERQTKALVSMRFLKNCLAFLEKALEDRGIRTASNKALTIAFLSQEEMRKLNKQFLNKDFVTDILSFSPLDKDSFGELALCGKKIQSQSKEHGLSVEEETAYLVLHGLLHLSGYHHESGGAPAEKMYKIQDEIFEKWQERHKQNL